MFLRFTKVTVAASTLALCIATLRAAEPPDRPSAIDAWPALAAAADSAQRDRVLLLRDGRVFTGEVTPDKEFYRVHVAGGHVQIPAGDVDAICNTLDDAYALRRKRLPPNQGSSHLDLAKWCLQNRLYKQAELELGAATRLEPQLPELPVVRRRLEWAIKRPTPSSPITTKTEEHTSAASKRADPSPSNADLELLVRGLSAGVTLEFKTYIQPMLVNRCATAACHGATADNRPRLVRLDRHGQVPRRITLRNLEETLAYVDRAKPSESLLLTKATEPHGGLKAAAIEWNETAVRQLSHWVRRASGATSERPATVATHRLKRDSVTSTSANLSLGRKTIRSPGTISRPATDSVQPARGRRPAPALPWVRELIDQELAPEAHANDEMNSEDALVAQIEADLEIDPYLVDPPSNAAELLGSVAETGDFTPVDAFDPEIFNRQFSPDIESVTEPADADAEIRLAEPVRARAASGDSPR